METVFRAYAKGAVNAYGKTPGEAAALFFESNPSKRKCNIIEGTRGNGFFTVRYGLSSKGEWPQSYRGVTRAEIVSFSHD